jgi:hypothetical protein
VPVSTRLDNLGRKNELYARLLSFLGFKNSSTVYQVEARGGCAVAVVVISGFMLKIDIKRPWYATPVRPDSPESGRIFGPLSFVESIHD